MSDDTKEPPDTCPREECQIAHLGGMSTAMAYMPVYDKHGNLTSHDPNTVSENRACYTCGARWTVWRQAGHRGVRIDTPPKTPEQMQHAKS